MALRFNSPPGWPARPMEWVPPAGWQPDPNWPPSPANWPFWVDVVEDPPSGDSLGRPVDEDAVAAARVPQDAGGSEEDAGLAHEARLAARTADPKEAAPSGVFVGAASQAPRNKKGRKRLAGMKAAYARHWKRTTAIVMAALLIATVGVVFVPKWLAPDVAVLQQRGDTAGLVGALSYWADAPTRAKAAEALGVVGAGDSVAPLLAAEKDQDKAVAAAATNALPQVLDRLPDDLAIVLLLKLADDKSVGPQASAARDPYLQRLGQVRALQALVVAEGTGSPAVSSAAAGLRQDVASLMPDDQVVLILIGQLTTASAEVATVDKTILAQRLAVIRGQKALRALLVALADGRQPVSREARSQITALLPKLSDGSAVGFLAALATDNDARVKHGAHTVLTGYLKTLGRRAVPAVVASGVSDEWLALALGVPLGQVSVTTKKRGIQIDSVEDINNAASAVSVGKGTGKARAYTANSSFHPIVLRGDEAFDWKAGEPTAIRFLELVGVIKSGSSQKVSVCPYHSSDGSTATVTRYRVVYVVYIVAARSGTAVRSRSFSGGTPKACAAKITAYAGEQITIEGQPPSQAQMVAWINSVVHAP